MALAIGVWLLSFVVWTLLMCFLLAACKYDPGNGTGELILLCGFFMSAGTALIVYHFFG